MTMVESLLRSDKYAFKGTVPMLEQETKQALLLALIHRQNSIHIWFILLSSWRRLEALLWRWTQDIRRGYQWCRRTELKSKTRLIQLGYVEVSLCGNRLVDKHISEYREDVLPIRAVLEILLEGAVAL
jgi:hypothetical protein